MIPAWLSGHDCSEPAAGACGTQSFLEKTLKACANFTAATVLNDLSAGYPGFLQKADPRVKLLGMLFLLVSASLLHSPLILLVLFLAVVSLASASGIALRFFLGRVAPILFFIGLPMVLPALLNVVTPGDPLLVVAHLGQSHTLGPYVLPAEIAVTRQGLAGGAVLMARLAASVSLAVLFPLTTRWNNIITALSAIRVPQLFVMVLAMTYRYIALLVQTVAELHDARKSRTIRFLPGSAERHWVAGRIGYLFGKSYRLSQEVHHAMLARGFTGTIIPLARYREGKKDSGVLAAVILFSVALVVLDRIV